MERFIRHMLFHAYLYRSFSDDMYDGITEVKKQVKDTTMILNSIASGDNVCASADYQKNRGKILDTGISLYEYMGKHSTHGKSIVIDDDIAVLTTLIAEVLMLIQKRC